MRVISITMDSMFPLKVLVINKSKDTHHKSVSAHFRMQSFFHFGFDALFLG